MRIFKTKTDNVWQLWVRQQRSPQCSHLCVATYIKSKLWWNVKISNSWRKCKSTISVINIHTYWWNLDWVSYLWNKCPSKVEHISLSEKLTKLRYRISMSKFRWDIGPCTVWMINMYIEYLGYHEIPNLIRETLKTVIISCCDHDPHLVMVDN